MVDIHHHLIFGVDDGSPDLPTSVAMVQMAAEDGVTHLVATPHANEQYPYDRSAHEVRLRQIRDALPQSVSSRIQLGLGSDFHLDYDNTANIGAVTKQYAINGGPYLLIELSDTGIPARIDELLYQMRVAGLTPILTHPERNSTLQRSRSRLREWMKADMLVQVTANSLTGQFGKLANRIAWELMENRWVHFVSSDAHDLTRRTPRLSAAYEAVRKRMGEDTAERLFVINPLAVFQGKGLPPQPEALGVFTDERRSWFSDLMRRFR
ncbi:tyrosine-protein phosphatase [Terriglobus aquaticus]|uniref:protein-tyrosine-phosphatase n=1 Tax=Terriglobus aquaticus TaxID=940139 RepID=A0ABW9KJX6_9BACT|nr:CpsB/CapC family capsule biosynthesis tyrosine phosphatase [Terriglobus aquaticus]